MRRDEIERLLPGVFQRTLSGAGKEGPLGALLDTMVELLQPREDAMQRLPSVLDPRIAPEDFVPLLSQWLNLDIPVTTGPGYERELIANAVDLSRWRGTAAGLIRFLSLATGASGFRIDEDVRDEQGKTIPCHIRIVAPENTRPHERMLERIIALYKPAYVTHVLEFQKA